MQLTAVDKEIVTDDGTVRPSKCFGRPGRTVDHPDKNWWGENGVDVQQAAKYFDGLIA